MVEELEKKTLYELRVMARKELPYEKFLEYLRWCFGLPREAERRCLIRMIKREMEEEEEEEEERRRRILGGGLAARMRKLKREVV